MDASGDVVGPPAGGVGGVGGVLSHLCTVLFYWIFSRIRRSRRSTCFKLTKLFDYSGCPLLRRDARSSIGPTYAKNLERGEGRVWLNGILKELLSRLSVFPGSCTPSLFFFFLAVSLLRWLPHRERATALLVLRQRTQRVSFYVQGENSSQSVK